MSVQIGFFGAAETVTGSRHTLTIKGKHVLVDCGIFQGGRDLEALNWAPFQIPAREIDAVVITHSHNDHIGLLPRLVSEGYSGPIYATPATIQLARIVLPDSGRIQEDDARHHNRHLNGRPPVKPLFTEEEAFAALEGFEPVPYGELHPLPGGAQFRYSPAGHILGSAFAEIYFENGEDILMSGDLGRYNTPIIKDPTTIEFADYLVIESTYGDRVHAHEDPEEKLGQILTKAWHDGSIVLVPTFAIGRTQELLYYLSRLQQQGRIPRIPIYIDSPMANLATAAYERATEEQDEDMLLSVKEGHSELHPQGLQMIGDREHSRELNSRTGPMMVIAGSGMANGGRIRHHLLHHIGEKNTVVLFTGYQAVGTLGRRIQEGADVVHIDGQEVQVHAQIESLNALSAHADQQEILSWLRKFKSPPKRTFIVHGEPPAQAALKAKIDFELGWDTTIPKMGDSFELSA